MVSGFACVHLPGQGLAGGKFDLCRLDRFWPIRYVPHVVTMASFKKTVFLCLDAVLFAWAAEFASASVRPAAGVLDPEHWRRQALRDLIPYWEKNARDVEAGAFYMNLSRDWKPQPSWDKVPALIGRHVFGFSAAYLLSGESRYLDIARDGVRYLFEHAWDAEYGGWFDRLSRDGRPTVDTKSVSLRLYTDVGLTEYYLASGEAAVLDRIRTSVAIQKARALDAERGGYAQTLARDLSVLDYGKNKHAHYGYVGSLLLNLYLAARDPAILAWEKELMDLSSSRQTDGEGWWHGFRNRLDREWRMIPTRIEGKEVVSVGAELTAALALLRLYHQSGEEKYLKLGAGLAARLDRYAFDSTTGAWREFLERKPPYGPVGEARVWWWIQIYGSLLQLQMYRVSGDGKYLDVFRQSEEFFENRLRDREKGGVYGSVLTDGSVLNDGRKASDGEWHTSYHEMEHALLNYLYLHLYVHGTPAVLYFRLDGPGRHFVSPVDDPAVMIASVRIEGQPWTDFDARACSISLPAGRGLSVEVTLAPAPKAGR
jgi:cellobiose epimerase